MHKVITNELRDIHYHKIWLPAGFSIPNEYTNPRILRNIKPKLENSHWWKLRVILDSDLRLKLLPF